MNTVENIFASYPDTSPRTASSGRTHSPTRETLLALLEAQETPVSVAQLSELSGCHENTVRGHLDALWGDGYAQRQRSEHRAQGRPSWLWSSKSTHQISPYAALAMALADGLAQADPDAAARASAIGHAWGLEIAAALPKGTGTIAARRAVLSTMRDQGFAPSVIDSSSDENTDSTTILLKQCPFVTAAAHNPDIICAIHLGMVTGVLAALGTPDAGSTIEPFSGPGECTLNLRASSPIPDPARS